LTTHATPGGTGWTPDEATGNTRPVDDPVATLVLLHGTTGDALVPVDHARLPVSGKGAG
jgi:hypothetical protein